jgi:glycosyltransferase involved in cell wall biosynthesis
MQTSLPGVSVMITSYNYGRFLRRAIDSARAQEIPNMEIVVIDNASTDGSWRIIDQAAVEDPRVHGFRNDTNIGPVANHVRGLRLTSNPKIITLSADDYLLPGHIARLLAAHVEHPDIDYVFCPYVFVDEEDRFLQYVHHPGHPRGSYFGDRNDFAALLAHDCYATVATTLFDRENIISKFEDPAIIAGDYDYYLRLAAEGAKFGFLDVAGVAIRRHRSQWTGEDRYVATGKQLLDQIAILEKYLKPHYAAKFAGHEQSIANLLLTKASMLSKYPEAATNVLPQAQPRIDALIDVLNESRKCYVSAPLSNEPLISVLLVTSDDLSATLRTIETLRAQSYSNWELVLVTNSQVNAAPLMLDRANPVKVRLLHHDAPQTAAVSLNDGLELAHGEIVAYAEPGALWPVDHLRRIASDFRSGPIEALIVPCDYIAYRSDPASRQDVEVAHLKNFGGSTIAESALLVGEAVPLSAFAHRRGLIDRLGRFDENLAHLTVFEFVMRIFGKVRTALDDESKVVMRTRLEDIPAAMLDPNGYLSALRTVYARHPVDPETSARRCGHFSRMKAEFEALLSGTLARDPVRFAALTRGVT